MFAQGGDDLFAQEFDAPHCGVVRLLSFARPESEIARIGSIDDVLELLNHGLGTAGDNEAGSVWRLHSFAESFAAAWP